METKRSSPNKKKPEYQVPKITRHGSLQKLTKAKRGAKADGGGVPRTRV